MRGGQCCGTRNQDVMVQLLLPQSIRGRMMNLVSEKRLDAGTEMAAGSRASERRGTEKDTKNI